jgi:KDO2-lipid IV(A) lauroyltransferase
MPGTPARPMAGADAQAIAVEAATVVNRGMARLIRALPGQYLWGYDRYKGPRSTEAAPAGPGDAA